MENKLPRNIVGGPRKLGRLLRTGGVGFWGKTGQSEVLKLFHEAAKRVPAYQHFLKINNIDPKKIKTLDDFKRVPPINKHNYLHVYPYESLVWDGDIKKPITIHSTSGSTGEPTYLQRDFNSDSRRGFIVDNFFKYNPKTLEGPTLFIITFGMGVWSGGMGMYTAAYLAINSNKYPISVISPGVNKTEVLKILKKIAPNFKQVIIAGYPPFVKDILDESVEEGVNLANMNLRFIFTGEAFSEEFRSYLVERGHIRNVFLDTMNTYGTSEFGATAVETPLSILVRRISDRKTFDKLFGDINKTPTLAQYVPYFVNFECVDGELLLTGDGTIPLIRYESGDNGGILTYDEIRERLKASGIDVEDHVKKAGLSDLAYKLPFVYVYERKNLATTLYGVLVYPEFIKAALIQDDLNIFLTGKFTLVQQNDSEQNQYLEINLELRKGVSITQDQQKIVLERIVATLQERSSEFRELSKNLEGRVFPRLVFWPYEHPEYFSPGGKQKWVKKIQK